MYAIQSIFQFFLCFYYCKNSLENRKTSKMIVTLIIIFSNESHRFVKEIPILAADLLRGTTFVRLSTSTSNRERRERGGKIDPSILEAYTSAKNNSNLLTSLSFAALPPCLPLLLAFAWWNGEEKTGLVSGHYEGVITVIPRPRKSWDE